MPVELDWECPAALCVSLCCPSVPKIVARVDGRKNSTRSVGEDPLHQMSWMSSITLQNSCVVLSGSHWFVLDGTEPVIDEKQNTAKEKLHLNRYGIYLCIYSFKTITSFATIKNRVLHTH